GLILQEVSIQFAKAGTYQYKVETSANNIHWNSLFELKEVADWKKEQKINVKDGLKVRFVRISFSGYNASSVPCVSEVEARGVVQN
ncbi:MAG: discoidin domain-containing protein, partial [Bacteroides sp.]